MFRLNVGNLDRALRVLLGLVLIGLAAFGQIGENFRDEAKALLGKADANKLIKLCQTESAPRVSFETTERGAAIAA